MNKYLLLTLLAFCFNANGTDQDYVVNNVKIRLTRILSDYNRKYAFYRNCPIDRSDYTRKSDNISAARSMAEFLSGLNLGHPYNPETTDPRKVVNNLSRGHLLNLAQASDYQ